MTRITLLFAFLATVLGAKAQQEIGTWSVTPRIGINSSVLTMDDVQYMSADGNVEKIKAKHKLGLTAGVETQYQVWPHIGLSGGLMYSNEGFQFDEMGDVDEWKASLHFLNVPLLVNYYIEPNVLPGLSLKTGVQLGYLLQSKEKLAGQTATNTDAYHRVGISIPAGVSYEYHNVVVDLRYNIGLSNLCDRVLDETWRSNSLWLTLGYQFGK